VGWDPAWHEPEQVAALLARYFGGVGGACAWMNQLEGGLAFLLESLKEVPRGTLAITGGAGDEAESAGQLYLLGEGGKLTWPGNSENCVIKGDSETAIVRAMQSGRGRPLNEVLDEAGLSTSGEAAYFQAQWRLNRKLASRGAPFHFRVREGVLELVPG